MYPPLLTDGEVQYHDAAKQRPKRNIADGMALYKNYGSFEQAELLIAHIGSIKEAEFCPIDRLNRTGGQGQQPDEWYYPNHLGLMGTLAMMDKLQPKAVVISEFGAELKDFRGDLVSSLAEALHDKQKDDNKPETPVIPGDITIVYDIGNDMLFCHEDCKFHPMAELFSREVDDWRGVHDQRHGTLYVVPGAVKRVHLFTSVTSDGKDHGRVKNYYEQLFQRTLPYFISKP